VNFNLDVVAYELTCEGESIKLERIPMELLMLLVERKGQLVTRGDILERLWGKDVFLDTDTSINTAIRKLRRAFQDDPEHPIFIQTVTAKGYRFVGPIAVLPVRPVTSTAATAAPDRRVMLAVLPFENLSNDPEQEYFSDGLTEETISYLGQISPERMGVIARTSTMAYKRTTKSIGQIGRELGVDYLLESSVRREGRRVRITSQLILVKDQTHLWADTYDRDMTSFLSVQAELGKAISGQVQIRLDPQSFGHAKARIPDPDAYDRFFRGKYYWNRFDHRQGIECFVQAIAADPEHAPSYAGLANCYAALTLAFDEPALNILPRAREAATRAVELDDFSADAHTSLGIVRMWLEWDWPGAESAFRRAIELNSSFVTAHMHYAHLLSTLGRHREAAAEIRIARQVDPLSPSAHIFSGIFMYNAREYNAAIEHLLNAMALNPNLWLAHLFLGKVHERKGMSNEALGAFQKAFDLLGGNTELISLKGYVHARQGSRAEAEQAVRLLTELSKQKYVPPYNIALVYAGLGEVEGALSWLEKAYETRDVRTTFLAVEAKWDALRDHPQFQDLLHRLALPLNIVTWESESGV
jgi:TolB-like protein/Flp pilus assembly protein TadD